MATEIVVPALGESVTTATVARWIKQAGEAVAADEPLVELETDKVTVEVNAPAAGVLSSITVPEGTEVEVGAVLGMLDGGRGCRSAEAGCARRLHRSRAPRRRTHRRVSIRHRARRDQLLDPPRQHPLHLRRHLPPTRRCLPPPS